ncbi:MAG: site-specific integrase [Vicinamibacterales bacterium]
MPKRARSGVKNLHKKHNKDCRNREPLRCDCPWYGNYKHVNVNLARWSGQYVDPRRRQHAVVVLNRLRASVDDQVFRPTGDYEALGGKQTLRSFIAEWTEHYAKVHHLNFASLTSMLRAIDREFGAYTLGYLQHASLQIERWLNDLHRQRKWSDNTWNHYYQMLNSLFVRAIKWRNGSVVRMTQNPMASIDRRTGSKRRFRKRLEEGLEDRLFAACDRLDDVKPSAWTKLDWEKAADIRTRAAAGECQLAIAADFKISPSLCCEVIAGLVWNPDTRVRRQGSMMRLRLMMAFDTGVRREEMMKVQVKHIDFTPVTVTIDGTARELLVIEVQSKGEKFTGEKERVYAGTERLIAALRARRDLLQNNPDAYVFGTASGFPQLHFEWHRLFRLAGLDYGRDGGVVWHTLRHEFCSRTAENTGDPVVAQELARHKDLRTTQNYLHARRSRVLAGAVSLNRRPPSEATSVSGR